MPNKITLPALPLSGGCQCGAVRYLVHAAPEVFYICHCTECQKQSASAFGQSLRVKSTAVTITGEMASFVRGSASGNDVACDFCPQCGSRLFHHRAQYAETMNVKAGTLDDTRWLKPAGHIWTKSAQGWVEIPEEGLNYPGQPESFDDLTKRWQAMLDA